jgi:zinc transport system substrate-binding protein
VPRRLLALALAGALAAALSGCATGGAGNGGRPLVAVAAYPFAWLLRQVGGPDVQVVDLVKGGAEPHDVELGPRQVAQVQASDLVVGLKGFQPALDDAVEDRASLLDLGPVMGERKASDGLGGRPALDPHVWLDPSRMAAAATAIGERLATVTPARAAVFRQRAATTRARLLQLDAAFRTGLAGCAVRDLVTGHAAFGYLATRYGLHQVGVTGTDPEGEPSPARVADVVRYARDAHVRTVFVAPGEPGTAQTVASELGTGTTPLDTLEAERPGEDYVSAMQSDLTALRTGLGCP